MEEIYTTVTEDGQMGALLVVSRRPRGCPGVGGWKKARDFESTGKWWTRVKGEEAERVLMVSRRAPGNVVTIILDGDKIADIEV